jgi:hypothetical protein
VDAGGAQDGAPRTSKGRERQPVPPSWQDAVMTSIDVAAAWRRGQQGWPAGFVLVQFPNPPLIVSLAGSVLAGLADGRAGAYAEAISRLGLAVFAYLELTDGANWFRRVLGAVVLVWLVITLGRALQ